MLNGTVLRDIGYEALSHARTSYGRWPLSPNNDVSQWSGEFAAHHYRTGQSHAKWEDLPHQGECVWNGTGNNPEAMVRFAIEELMRDEPHKKILIEENACEMGVGTHVEEVRLSLYCVVVVVRIRFKG